MTPAPACGAPAARSPTSIRCSRGSRSRPRPTATPASSATSVGDGVAAPLTGSRTSPAPPSTTRRRMVDRRCSLAVNEDADARRRHRGEPVLRQFPVTRRMPATRHKNQFAGVAVHAGGRPCRGALAIFDRWRCQLVELRVHLGHQSGRTSRLCASSQPRITTAHRTACRCG